MIFTEGRYPQKFIETETGKVKFSVQRVFHTTKVEKGVPLVVTYHPLLKTIGKIIHDHLYLIYMNQELKHLFTPGPIVSFTSSRKISSYLVRAKLYPVERSVGSFNFKRPRCQICTYLNEMDSFTSTVPGETNKINHKFDHGVKILNRSNNSKISIETRASASRWFYYKILLWDFKYYCVQIKKVSYCFTSKQSVSNHVSPWPDMRFLLAFP